jgi:N-acetylglucosamine malate deacetylase 1
VGLLRALKRAIERVALGRSAYKFILREWERLPDAEAVADLLATMRLSRLLEPISLPGPSKKRIAVLAPHPDDEMIGPGGTLIAALRKGARVDVVYLTNGDDRPDRPRVTETTVVARRVGYSTEFLALDRPLTDTDAGARRLAEAIRPDRETCLFAPFVLDDHPEHRTASLLLARAHALGLLPGDLEVWAYQVYSALPTNVVVEIDEVHEEKANAIRGWAQSAMRSRDWAHYALGLNAYNSRFLGGSKPSFAETFFVLPLKDYAELCRRYRSGIAGATPS